MSKPKEEAAPQPQPESDSGVYFQYEGKTALTIIGPNSRKRYRFDRPGAVVGIDPRDKRALASMSVLKQVKKEAIVAV